MRRDYPGKPVLGVTADTVYASGVRPSTLLAGLIVALAAPAWGADPIGQIKSASGAVAIERTGATRPGTAGDRVLQSDVVSTGPDGAVGITFDDNSMMSLGPDSTLALDSFTFDRTTHDGK